MHVERAYAERESLSDSDLERLRSAFADQVRRYEDTIENYPPDRMEKHGKPFLARLQEKLVAVDAIISTRVNGS